MKRVLVIILLGLTAGCGPGGGGAGSGLPAVLPLPIFLPVPVGLLNDTQSLLEGQWVIADAASARSCLVIQESRVSIIDVNCSSDGSGFASRIISAPQITRAGDVIVLTVTYNLRSDTSRRLRLIFTGVLQDDGTFVGTRRDEDLVEETVFPERFAIMTRP